MLFFFGFDLRYVLTLMCLFCAASYPYVSHLICNAGVAPFVGISMSLLLRQLWRDMLAFNLLRFVVYPTYAIQRKGVMSDDGLGWTWQCNVFGHYILVRTPPYVFYMLQRTDDSVRTCACTMGCFIIVPNIGGEACGVADGTRPRRLDVLVHGRSPHL